MRRGWSAGVVAAAVTVTLAALMSVPVTVGPATPAAVADVPPATGTTSVITVATGSERPTQTEVGPLAGVTLQLFGGSSAPNPTPLPDAWATCVSDAKGDCSFVVPETQTGGANRDQRFWVKQTGAPAGWFVNPSLVTGPANGLAATAYQFRTGTQLRAGNTYSSSGPGASFMQSSGNTNRQASGGIWQSSRTNPVLPAQCGLDVALVLDVSGSVGADLPNLKAAAKTFTNSLIGTPSQLALFTFSSNAPANTTNNKNRPLTPVSTLGGANQVNTWIDGLTSGGGTNWDRGFFQVAQETAHFDVAVVITDGNPTYYGNQEGPGNFTRFHEVEDGIFSANSIKAENTRVIAVGVGSGVSGDPANLQAISGPVANDDYYQTTDYQEAGDALRALALGNCAGSITVVKQVVPSTAPPGSIQGATPAGGWTFGAQTVTSGVTITPASGQTADGTGALNFALTFPGGTSTAAVTFAETQQPGYGLVTVAGQNAVCTRLDTAALVPVENVGETGFSVSGQDDQPISCVIYNRAPNPQASVVVNKNWVVNGETLANGDQPEYLIAGLLVDGTEQPWGEERTDLVAGSTVPITEQIDTTEGVSGLRLCTLDSALVTEANGVPISQPVDPPYQAQLQAGTNTYTITNVVTCQTKLTLNKLVLNGGADPASWTLTAVAPDGALTGPTGATGVTGDVSPDAAYSLAESGGDPNYLQLTLPDEVLSPGSTGTWICVEVDQDGLTQVPGYIDGLSGSVTVPLGTWVSCFAVNATASLTMIKNVVNDHGGAAVPADWNLTATPAAPNLAGAPTQTVTGSTDGVTVNVRPDQAYDLSESTGPAGYALDSVTCEVENAERDFTGLTLAPGDSAVCTFTNSDQPAHLTLVKSVDNGSTGGTAGPRDWTLAADGPTAIQGASGDLSITGAEVQPGSYQLIEANGPGGYNHGDWVCTGATATGAVVDVPVGADVTCTITNTAVPPTLTLVKQVENRSGGSAVPADWILSAADEVTISGHSGDPSVTAAVVPVGSYQLSESGGPTGYDGSAWSCTGASGSDPTSVQLHVGDAATCTITNTDTPARLTLQKVVDPAASGSGKVPADWTITATPDGIAGQDPVSGNGDPTSPDGVSQVNVFAGSYDLTESGPAGFDAGQWVCEGGVLTGASVRVPSGGTVICTITNTAVSPTLTLVKTVDNGNTGATAVPTDWTLSADGPTPISGATADPSVTAASVQVGAYPLDESGPPGYTAGDWHCVGGSQDGGTVTLAEGENATCTITNSAVPPTLTLVKVVDNGATGATAEPVDWTLTAAGPTPISGVSGGPAVTAVPVDSGEYTLAEQDGPAGYTASDWSCIGARPIGNTVPVAGAGVAVSCTIKNTAVSPTLTLVKVVDNGNTGVTTEATDWTLTAQGPTPISGPTGDPAVTGAVVKVGSYSLGESGPSGYSVGEWSCAGGQQAGATVTLGAGGNATCTITNTAIPGTWLLTKSADPPSDTVVSPGTTITYQLTATHQAGVAVIGAVATDDLTQVLSYSTLEQPLADGLSLSGTQLTWTVPEIPVGGTAQVSYQATVHPDLDGVVIVNGADPATPGGQCGQCTVDHPVAAVPPQPPHPPTPPTPPGPPTPPSPTPLPDTGVPVGEYLGWAFGLMAAGSLVLLAVRRRGSRR